MLLKTIVVIMLLLIFASLVSGLVLLFRKHGSHSGVAKALTWRIALSVTLFVLLMAGFYFGFIPQEGLKMFPGP